MFKNKYTIKYNCDDFIMTIDNSSIKISGFIKVKFDKIQFAGVDESTLKKMSGFIYADLFSIIIDNFNSPNEIKKLLLDKLNEFKNIKNPKSHKILSYKIDDVYNVEKRIRLNKLNKITSKLKSS